MLNQKKQRGVTLIELVITVVVLAIIIAFAVPSYQQMAAKSAIRAASQDLRSALSETRAEALGQRKAVALESTSGTCGEAEVEGWAHGWEFTNFTNDKRQWRVEHCYIEITVTPSDTDSITFLRSGFYKKASSDDEGAEFCISSPRANNYVHKVKVSVNGQINVRHASTCG